MICLQTQKSSLRWDMHENLKLQSLRSYFINPNYNDIMVPLQSTEASYCFCVGPEKILLDGGRGQAEDISHDRL